MDMEEVDAKTLKEDSKAAQKGCKDTAIALVKLADAVISGDLAAVVRPCAAIHPRPLIAGLCMVSAPAVSKLCPCGNLSPPSCHKFAHHPTAVRAGETHDGGPQGFLSR
jgi:hypothetical protein